MATMRDPVILIALRDRSLRQEVHRCLAPLGYTLIDAFRHQGSRPGWEAHTIDLAIFDAAEGGPWYGIQAGVSLRQRQPRVPLILLCAHSSEQQAIAALRAGFNDFFPAPFSWPEVVQSVHRHLSEATALPGAPHSPSYAEAGGSWSLVGESLVMQKIKTAILKAASTEATVLITGETGTGKDRAAEMLHQHSRRHHKPLVCINCAALPDSLIESELFGFERGAFTGAHWSYEGKLKQAELGTAYLDEIGDMSLLAQAKILRVLESKEIFRVGGKKRLTLNVRLIASTNRNLEALVDDNTFRKDLYFRINVIRIHLPPLRERKEDIPLLVAHFLRELNERYLQEVLGLTEEASDFILDYDWPGNVRELKNLLEACYINADGAKISLLDFPEPFRRRLKELQKLPRGEMERLLSALLATNWNKSQAAAKLHWSRMTLYRKMAKFQIPKTAGGLSARPSSPSKSGV
jgi:DNA-binding NtrC family response regulator